MPEPGIQHLSARTGTTLTPRENYPKSAVRRRRLAML
jgi:hypothetical protein